MCESGSRQNDHSPFEWLTEPQPHVTGLRINLFLEALRSELHGLPAIEVDEIVRELRSHLMEQLVAHSETGAVAAMGSPTELAAMYMEDRAAPQPIMVKAGVRGI